MFDSVVDVCAVESETMIDVFSNPAVVMQRFLERIYEQRVCSFLAVTESVSASTSRGFVLRRCERVCLQS